MRGCLLLAILAAVAVAAEPSPDGGRLRRVGEDWEAVNHALIRLRQGDVEPLAALPPSLFTEPLAAEDPTSEDAPLRQWTTWLPEVVATLPQEARARALATLDACWRGRVGLGDAPSPGGEAARAAALAVRFLPAPGAVAALAAERDRAFDRGRFALCLALDALLARAGARGDDDERRVAVARRLSGLAAAVDDALALPAPGLPVPTAARAADDGDGMTVSWRREPGLLAADDPWGAPLWQRPVPRDATVVTGAGGAVVLAPTGLRLVREDGVETAHPPPPPGTRALAVAGGAAWFARGVDVHRVDLATGEQTTLTLPDEPVCAPLVRGRDSLWLTAREILLFRDDRLAHRLPHGLEPAPGWRLGVDQAQLVIDAGAARNWRLETFADQLRRAAPGERVRLLDRARRWREALDLVAAQPELLADDGVRVAALAAWATAAATAEEPATARDALARATPLARDDGELLAPLWQAWRAGAAEPAAVAELAARAPVEAEYPAGDDLPVDPPEGWRHALGARGIARLLRSRGAREWPTTCDPAAPVAGEPIALADAPAERRSGDGPYRGVRIALAHGAGFTAAAARDAASAAPLWRHRWRAAPLDSAPARSWSCVDDALLVGEGADRLVAIALDDGAVIGHVDLRGCEAQPSQALVARRSPLRIAVVHPVGIERSLTIADERGERTVAVASRIRWAVPLPGGAILVRLADGALLAFGDGVAATAARLPSGLDGETAPIPTAEGLVRDGRCWRWSTR